MNTVDNTVCVQTLLSSVHMFSMLQLYVWGSGSVIGCGSVDAIDAKPRLVEDLQTVRIVDIASGDSHCLALTYGTSYHKIHSIFTGP